MYSIINQNDLILDNEEKLIPNAKLYIEYLNTNTLAPIYTLNNNQFVIAENPIILNDFSRVDNTIFGNGILQARLYFEDKFIRDWQVGIETSDIKNDTIVFGIDGLKEANIELETIDVIGYWNNFDCERRTYYWDSECEQTSDNGYIVSSNHTENGRWILKFDLEYLPSTYYGVYPGHESNINALLNYVDKVGSIENPTAPGIYFIKGSYTGSSVSLITDKKILIDSDTKFSRETIECSNLEIIGNVLDNICDFKINGGTVHSSWFRTITGFLTSGADTFIIDETNYFEDTNIENTIELTNKILEFNTRLPITYLNNVRLKLDNCILIGKGFFNNTDRLQFLNSIIHDEWWSNEIDWSNTVLARTSGLNKLDINNFIDPKKFMAAKVADGWTDIDFENRRVNSIEIPETVTMVSNLEADSIEVNSTQFILNNSSITSAEINSSYLTINDSEIGFAYQPRRLICNNSIIHSTNIWKNNVQITAKKCIWDVTINNAKDNSSDLDVIEFIDCSFENVLIATKRLKMTACNTINTTIRIYPYKDTNNKYQHYVYFEGNTFNNNTPIEFTRFDVENGNESQCYEVIATWNIIGNNFIGNDYGIKCRYWANIHGIQWTKTFIKFSNENNIIYQGNNGNCPKEDLRGFSTTSNWTCPVDIEGSLLRWDMTSEIRAITKNISRISDYLAIKNNSLYGIKINNTTYTNSMIGCVIGHLDNYITEDSDNGDLFRVTVVTLTTPNNNEFVSHVE